MKKECEQTRKTLRRYLRGHVYAVERKRIEQHLATCPLCSSEFQSLKRSDETTQFLRDITPPEGLAGRAQRGVSALASARKILYRPLWVLGALAVGYLMYHFVVAPYLQEQEREWRELSAPSKAGSEQPASVAPTTAVTAPTSIPAAPTPPAAISPAALPAAPKAVAPAAPAKKPNPLMVTITVEDERAAMRRLNEVMRGHGVLRTQRFTDAEKEVSGELTPKELMTLFGRIEAAGRITYSRKRFEAAPSAELLPFVLKLAVAPRTAAPAGGPGTAAVRPEPKPAEQASPQPAAQAAPNQTQQAPQAR